MTTDRIPPRRYAVVGSSVIVDPPSMHRRLRARVREIDGDVLAVETRLGVIRVRRADCHPCDG